MRRSMLHAIFIGTVWLSGCITADVRRQEKAAALEQRIIELQTHVNASLDDLHRLSDERARLEIEGHYRLMSLILSLNRTQSSRFNFQKLAFQKPLPYGAEDVAKADLEDGNINVLIGGFHAFMDQEKNEEMLKKYGILIVDVGGCTEGRHVWEFTSAYNKPVEEYIQERYGKSLMELYRQKDR